ncbi:MAG TPA: c-type cytochrome [Candidatus Nanopelagicales bacterium]|jgi:ubiquinol-cytochrome c reductase cytochrome c subunit
MTALVATGITFAAVSAATSASAAPAQASQTQVEAGRQLYLEGCATCHGLGAQGTEGYPSLIGVGAAAVDFQVSTGRMPLAESGVQAPQKPNTYTPEQISDLAAFVASLGAGPAIPSDSDLDTSAASLSEGGELFRINCQQCHNFAGVGGALSDGAYAPSLMNATPRLMWEAMVTGPQQMPVFSNGTLTPQNKQAIIKYITDMQSRPDPGGLSLGSYGPVTEGLFAWIAGLGALLAAAVWIGAKVR